MLTKTRARWMKGSSRKAASVQTSDRMMMTALASLTRGHERIWKTRKTMARASGMAATVALTRSGARRPDDLMQCLEWWWQWRVDATGLESARGARTCVSGNPWPWPAGMQLGQATVGDSRR
jgi:hypothetical protein